MLVVLWLALIVYTYLDASAAISDPFLVAARRSPRSSLSRHRRLRDRAAAGVPRGRHERELEISAAELRVRQLNEQTCPNCEYPVEKNFLRCPNCQRRLKDPCPTCSKPVDPRWTLCPYCETGPRRERRGSRAGAGPGASANGARDGPAAGVGARPGPPPETAPARRAASAAAARNKIFAGPPERSRPARLPEGSAKPKPEKEPQP